MKNSAKSFFRHIRPRSMFLSPKHLVKKHRKWTQESSQLNLSPSDLDQKPWYPSDSAVTSRKLAPTCLSLRFASSHRLMVSTLRAHIQSSHQIRPMCCMLILAIDQLGS